MSNLSADEMHLNLHRSYLNVYDFLLISFDRIDFVIVIVVKYQDQDTIDSDEQFDRLNPMQPLQLFHISNHHVVYNDDVL